MRYLLAIVVSSAALPVRSAPLAFDNPRAPPPPSVRLLAGGGVADTGAVSLLAVEGEAGVSRRFSLGGRAGLGNRSTFIGRLEYEFLEAVASYRVSAGLARIYFGPGFGVSFEQGLERDPDPKSSVSYRGILAATPLRVSFTVGVLLRQYGGFTWGVSFISYTDGGSAAGAVLAVGLGWSWSDD